MCTTKKRKKERRKRSCSNALMEDEHRCLSFKEPNLVTDLELEEEEEGNERSTNQQWNQQRAISMICIPFVHGEKNYGAFAYGENCGGLYVYNSSHCSSLAQCTCGNKQEERRNSNDALVDEEEEEEESFIAWASRKEPNVVKKNLKKNGIKDQCNNNNNNGNNDNNGNNNNNNGNNGINNNNNGNNGINNNGNNGNNNNNDDQNPYT